MTRKVKAHLELNMARHDKKGFFSCISSKRKSRGNLGPLLNEVLTLVVENTKKAELLNAFFVSVFTANAGPQEYQTLKARNSGEKKTTFLWLMSIGLERT